MREITKEIQNSEDALKAMIPDVPHRIWHVHLRDADGVEWDLRYVQSELSFFEKQDFTTLIGRYFDRFAEGEFGIGIKDIFSDDLRTKIAIPTEVTPEAAEKMVDENTGLIKAIIKVVNELPDLQMKIILIALGVPPKERKAVAESLRGPVWKGGLTDDQGFDILKTFISQNAVAIRDFFLKRARDLVDHFQNEVFPQEEAEPEDQKPPSDGTHGGTPSSISPPESVSIPTTSDAGQPVASS